MEPSEKNGKNKMGNQAEPGSTLTEENQVISASEGRGFKQYLLDGLMIFLAIALGFISENIREDIVEKKITREFALSMIKDLRSDTTNLEVAIGYYSRAGENIDSLQALLLKNDLKEIPTGKLYYYGLWGGADIPYVSNDATFQQMKNSGLLRNVTNNSLLKRILDYDRLNRELLSEVDRDNLLHVEVRKVRGQIFNFKYNMEANDIVQANRTNPDQRRVDVYLRSEPPLLTYDPIVFNQYMELVRSRNIKGKARFAKILLGEARLLIEELEKEYQQE